MWGVSVVVAFLVLFCFLVCVVGSPAVHTGFCIFRFGFAGGMDGYLGDGLLRRRLEFAVVGSLFPHFFLLVYPRAVVRILLWRGQGREMQEARRAIVAWLR